MHTPQTKWEDTIQRVGVVVGCVIEQEGKYLLVQEKQPSAYGMWNLPAGHVDKGESIQPAALREVKEETGYEVELEGELALYHESAHQSVKHVFAARIVAGKLAMPSDEILDVN